MARDHLQDADVNPIRVYTATEAALHARKEEARVKANEPPPLSIPEPVTPAATQPTMIFRCADCPKTFTSKQGLLLHRRKIHPAPPA